MYTDAQECFKMRMGKNPTTFGKKPHSIREDAASAAGSATIRRETEEADGITRERDLGRGNSESRPVSPVLNSDGARKKCVNWGSRGDVAECASLLGSSACWVARRAWIVVRVCQPLTLRNGWGLK